MSFMYGLLLAPFIGAQAVETTEAFKAAAAKSVIQSKLEDCDFAKPISRGFDGIQVATEPGGDVSVSGKDHSGNNWNATYKATPGAGCQLWKVDLGRYGGLDLAFLSFGANSSGGWDTTLSLLLFDQQGRPFPWQATSRFTVTDLGIRELVLLGEARLPTVIVALQNTDAGQGDPEYHAFKFITDRASEIIGKQGNTVWPIVSPLQTPRAVIAKGSLSTDEPGNGLPGAGPISYLSLLGNTDSERRLHLSNEDVGVPKVLVVDANGTRQITSTPDKTDLLKLRAGAIVRAMLGQDCSGNQCSPMVIWVSE